MVELNIQKYLLVLSATPIIPPIKHTVPANTNQRGPYASKTGPICTPQKNVRKAYRLKIQPTALGDSWTNWCVLRYAWNVPALLRIPKLAVMPLKEPRTTSQARRPPSGKACPSVWSCGAIFSLGMGPSVSIGGTWLETLTAEPLFFKTGCHCSPGVWHNSLLLS